MLRSLKEQYPPDIRGSQYRFLPFLSDFPFLAHLSRRLKWVFLNTICPLSVGSTGPISYKLGTKHPWVKGIKVYLNEWPRLFPRRYNTEIAFTLTNFGIFSRTTGPISNKLSRNYSSVKGTEGCSNEGPCPFPRGDNNENAKIHWHILKIFFRTTGPHFNQTWQKVSLGLNHWTTF